MKQFLETTLGKSLLGGVVVIIWAMNVHTFTELSGGSDTQNVQQNRVVNLETLTVPSRAVYTYQATIRDPFKSNIQSRAPMRVESREEEDESMEEAPELTLTGIFDGMAVITDASGVTYFAKEGDSFKPELLLKRVVEDFVVVEYNQRNIILKLNQEE